MSWLTDPDADWDERHAPPRHRLKVLAAALAGWLAVSLIVLVGLLRFHDRGSPADPAAPAVTAGTTVAASTRPAPTSSAAATSTTPTSTTPSASPSTGAAPAGWSQRAHDVQTNCTAHSYGLVQVFFAKIPCAAVRRGLLTTEQDGRSIVVATSTVTFRHLEQATSYLRLVTADGTGNVNDLLREGIRYPGSPSKLPETAFASRQDGLRVLVAEAGYVDGRSDSEDPALQAAARKAIAAG